MKECNHVWRWNDMLKQTDCLVCGMIHHVIIMNTAGSSEEKPNTSATLAPDATISVGVMEKPN